jgi:hypothetical protein
MGDIVLVVLAEGTEALGQLTLTTDYIQSLMAVTGGKRNYSKFYAICDVFSQISLPNALLSYLRLYVRCCR